MEEVRFTLKLSQNVYDQLKLLCILHNKKLNTMIEECIMKYPEVGKHSDKIKQLNHTIYKLKYDSHEKGQ